MVLVCLLYGIVSPWGNPYNWRCRGMGGLIENRAAKTCAELTASHNTVDTCGCHPRNMRFCFSKPFTFITPNIQGPSFKTFQIRHGQPMFACGALMILIDC